MDGWVGGWMGGEPKAMGTHDAKPHVHRIPQKPFQQILQSQLCNSARDKQPLDRILSVNLPEVLPHMITWAP